VSDERMVLAIPKVPEARACRLPWSHWWGRWEDTTITRTRFVSVLDQMNPEVAGQTRVCIRCGKRQVRTLGGLS
jgi:hypothetical protein